MEGERVVDRTEIGDETSPVIEEFDDVKLVMQSQPTVRSVALLVAAGVGSADEPIELSGISHLIEHTAFKGTEKRDARSIKLPVERSGGTLNAFTSRVATVYYAHIPREVFDETADILLDLYSHPLFDPEALELEKSVVLEEIKESMDEPTDIVFNQLTEEIWGENFGKSILGKPETVSALTRDDLVRFHRSNYTKGKTLVVAFGNVSLEELKERLSRSLDELPSGSHRVPPSPRVKDNARGLVLDHKKDLNQVHVVFFKPLTGRRGEERAIMQIVNTALGSGMSSLLFEEIRERRGLVYTVGTDLVLYRDSGGLFIYAATSEDKFWNLSEELRSIFEKLVNEGMEKSLFEYGKRRLIGGLELSYERTLNNAFRLLDDVLNFDRPRALDEILREIERVRLEDVNDFLSRNFTGRWYISVVAPEGFDPTKVDDRWKI